MVRDNLTILVCQFVYSVRRVVFHIRHKTITKTKMETSLIGSVIEEKETKSL